MPILHLAASATDIIKGSADKACSGSQCGATSFSATLEVATNALLYLSGAIAVIILIVAGIKFIISGGDSKAVEEAKRTILYAIIGLGIVIFAFAITRFIFNSIV